MGLLNSFTLFSDILVVEQEKTIIGTDRKIKSNIFKDDPFLIEIILFPFANSFPKFPAHLS
jgi:hypothetical protein